MGKARSRSRQEQKGKSWPDVACKLIDTFYNLANNGKLYPYLLFLFPLLGFFWIWKIPGADVGYITKRVLAVLADRRWPLFISGVISGVSMVTLVRQRRMYRREIHRLAGERMKVIHGIEKDELKILQTHVSSNYNYLTDTYHERKEDGGND